MADQTIEPAIARPRGLPGLSRRDERTVWLTTATGDRVAQVDRLILAFGEQLPPAEQPPTPST